MSGPVLVAEDEESDALILRLAFAKAGLSDSLVIVGNGQEAVDYLAGKAPYNDRAAHPLPSVVLLDLKMPRLSGFEVLKWLRENAALRKVPAVVLSSSPDESDIRKARQMGACDYFVKPFGVDALVDIVQTVRTRWLGPHEAGEHGGEQATD
jgi:CheY-like chemotaxis protein